jgi:hypothetical protein
MCDPIPESLHAVREHQNIPGKMKETDFNLSILISGGMQRAETVLSLCYVTMQPQLRPTVGLGITFYEGFLAFT